MPFPTSVRTAWVVKSVATNPIDTSKLLPFQVGIFDYEKHKIVQNFSANPFIYLACGSPNTKEKNQIHPKLKDLNNRNVDVSFKSQKIFGRELLPARVAKPSKENSPYVLYLGYDGLNDCKTLPFECGKTYGIRVYLEPSGGVGMTMPNGMNDLIYVTTPACDNCGDSCFADNLCQTVLDEAVNKLNKSWVAPYIKFDKILSCCPADAAVPKFLFKEWCLTLCDEGNGLALARVQNQYPGVKIERISRVNTNSTYQFCQPAADPTPAPYTQRGLIIPNCPTCPAGYTAQPTGKIAFVTIDNAGTGTTPAQWLTEVQAVVPTAIEAVKTGFQYGTSSYIVTVPVNYVIPATPLTDATITLSEEVVPVKCLQDTIFTVNWEDCGDKYKIKRKLCIQLKNPDCNGATELPEIIEHLSAEVNIVPNSVVLEKAGDCLSQYSVEQYNNACLEDGCDTLAIAHFDRISAYKGQVWAVCPCEGWTVDATSGCPIPPVSEEKDCRCGIKLTGGFIDMSTQACMFDVTDAVNYDPIRFSVSVVELSGTDQIGGSIPVDVDVFVAQNPKSIYLSGQEVIRDILTYRFSRDNEVYFSPQMPMGYKFLANAAQELGVDVNKFYYAVNIQHSVHGRISSDIRGMAERREITLYFEESDYGVMQQFLVEYNKYATSAGINLPAVI